MLHHEQKLFYNRTFITDIRQAPSEPPEHIVTDNWKATFKRTKTKGRFCLSHLLRLPKSTENLFVGITLPN